MTLDDAAEYAPESQVQSVSRVPIHQSRKSITLLRTYSEVSDTQIKLYAAAVNSTKLKRSCYSRRTLVRSI